MTSLGVPELIYPVRIVMTFGPTYTAFCMDLACTREIGKSRDRERVRTLAAQHVRENHAR